MLWISMRSPPIVAGTAVLLVLALLSAAADEIRQQHLRVTARKDGLANAPSCQHTFSQVELLNVNPSENVVIRSIRTTAEETYLVESDDGGKRQRNDDNKSGSNQDQEDLPQQLHVSKLPSSTLSLGPGEVAIVPITFLPRFPRIVEQRYDSNNNIRREPTASPSLAAASAWQQADLDDWLGGGGSSSSGSPPREQEDPPPPSTRAEAGLGGGILRPVVRSNRPLMQLATTGGGERYEVNAKILVETDHGPVDLYVTCTSVRENSYGLPDTIYFDLDRPTTSAGGGDNGTGAPADCSGSSAATDSGADQECSSNAPHAAAVSSSPPRFSGDAAAVPESTNYQNSYSVESSEFSVWVAGSDGAGTKTSQVAAGGSTPLWPQEDCYDVYVRNPGGADEFKDDLKVMEVLLSQPEHLALHVFPEKDHGGRMEQTRTKPSQPAAVIRELTTDGGPLRIPADGKQHYVATVCTSETGAPRDEDTDAYLQEMSDWVDPGDEDTSLGFLQIRTDVDVLFIGLERSGSGNGTRTTATITTTAPSSSQQQQDALTGEQQEALLAMQKFQQQHEEERQRKERLKQLAKETTTEQQQTVLQKGISKPGSLLLANPGFLKFRLFSQGVRSAATRVAVSNFADERVILMRASAGLKLSDKRLNPIVKLNLKVGQKHTDQHGAVSIQPNRTVEDAIWFGFTVDWDKFKELAASPREVVHFNGTLVLRCTSRDLHFTEWMEAIKKDPTMDSHLVLEIPFRISIVLGHMGLLIQGTTHPYNFFYSMEHWHDEGQAISAAFFPSTVGDVKAVLKGGVEERVYELKSMEHHIRVFTNFTNMGNDMKLRSADIVRDKKSPGTGTDTLCSRFEVAVADGDNPNPFDMPDHSDLGLVYLRYRFPPAGAKTNKTFEGFPTVCYLRLTTDPPAGELGTPLIIYPGTIDISASKFQSDFLPQTVNAKGRNDDHGKDGNWHNLVVGFEKLLKWFETTKAGSALLSVLEPAADSRKHPDRDGILLGRYLYSLARQATADIEESKLRPVLLEVGAIPQGETETFPLYFTNHNPTPVLVSVIIGEVEGMSVSLGRDLSSGGAGDGNCVFDYLPGKPRTRILNGGRLIVPEPRISQGPYAGHPINGLRQFLLSDKNVVPGLFGRYPYRDAISLSDLAVGRLPVLEKQYNAYSFGECRRTAIPARLRPESRNRCNSSAHPPHYGQFARKLSGRRLPGPIIVSSDGRMVRRLPVCWDRERDEPPGIRDSDVVVPPGGIARFDVSLRAPSSSILEHDISQFLATGLVLSTSHGEVMPIFASFQTLLGKLEIGHIPNTLTPSVSDSSPHRDSVIRVPVELFARPSPGVDSKLMIPPSPSRSFGEVTRGEIVRHNASLGENGVSIFMRSSFSREVALRKVLSCNPWFEVILRKRVDQFRPDPFLGVNIGEVISRIPCDYSARWLTNSSGPPSFFHCALNWLAKRAELQPQGCGLQPTMEKRSIDVDGNQVAERSGVDRAVRAFKQVLAVAQWTGASLENASTVSRKEWPNSGSVPVKSGRRVWDGVVASATIDAVAEAWDAWRTVSELGVRVLSTNLRAVIEYNSTNAGDARPTYSSATDEAQRVSVALGNLTIEASMEPPKLLDAARARVRFPVSDSGNDEQPSMVEFPPTLVASSVSVMLPLRNPTAVPVRVRLGVAASEDEDQIRESQIGVDYFTRSRFVGNLPYPYVQTGRMPDQKRIADHQWWDGGGAFFLADHHGDVVRSHHNVTVRAGSGAHVSLVNPSMTTSSAFVVGCGSRCGVRDATTPKKIKDANVDIRGTSPIGASAAFGKTLVGHRRSAAPLPNQVSFSNPNSLQAGGSLLSSGDGPVPFAIPFSALDEIVIPPFGEAEIGPLMFRPPGRSAHIGCDPQSDSQIPPWCESRLFKSTVFLENSLTGLERIDLQGKAQWEKLIFVDPLPKDGSLDSFSDIEQRNGRSALLFPGTAERSKVVGRAKLRSVVKEVVVHNSGDVAVDVENMFLSDASNLNAKVGRRGRQVNPCSMGDFLLLSCPFACSGEVPFTLHPGQNRSLFIEHFPRCKKRRDFIALNLELRHDKSLYDSSSTPGFTKRIKGTGGRNSFLKKKIELIVGYDMTDKDFHKCLSVSERVDREKVHKTGAEVRRAERFLLHGRPRASEEGKIIAGFALRNNNPAFRRLVRRLASIRTIKNVLLFLLFLVNLLASLRVVCRCYVSRQESSDRFQAALDESEESKEAQSGNNWFAAFRCLARADPTSTDLQSLGREQFRQVVLARCGSLGVLQPQYLSNAGAFNRERTAASNAGSRQATPAAKDGNPGSSEKIRTLSDGIFHKFTKRNDAGVGLLPCGLGWRTAATRGINSSASSLENPSFTLKTQDLLLQRQRAPVVDEKSSGCAEEDNASLHASADSMDYSDAAASSDDSGGRETSILQSCGSVSTSTSETTDANRDDAIPSKESKESSVSNEIKIHNDGFPSADDDGYVETRREQKKKNHLARANGARRDAKSQKANKASTNDTSPRVAAASTPKQQNEFKGKNSSKANRREAKGVEDHSPADKNHDTRAKKKTEKELKPKRAKPKPEGGSVKTPKKNLTMSSGKTGKAPKKNAWKTTEPATPPASSTPSQPAGPTAIRPPPGLPGLAPPPGFGGSPSHLPTAASSSGGTTAPSAASVTNSTPSTVGSHHPAVVSSLGGSQYKPVIVARTASGDSSLSGDNFRLAYPTSPAVSAFPIPTAHSTESVGAPIAEENTRESGDVPAAPESGAPMTGFDVFDFLDGILNDGSDGLGGNRVELDASAVASVQAMPVSSVQAMPGSSVQAMPVSSVQAMPVWPDPWATSLGGTASRAAAYGISIDEESERSNEPGSLNLPRLTPAAILSSQEVGEILLSEEVDEDETKQNAFYSGLVGE